MKLLIVDDQPGVLEGLIKGIDWEAEGFTCVSSAQNAARAREEFQKNAPDVLLCDIEMPVENGLELFKWVKENDYKTCCVFLTSHAEFGYAKEAIRLGAFDYVVSPAPYPEVASTVRRAVEFVRTNKKKQMIYDVGEQLLEDKIQIAASLQRDLLLGASVRGFAEKIGALGSLPVQGKPCFLVMIQILRWHSLTDRLETGQMAVDMAKILNQIFGNNTSYIVVSQMNESTLAFMLQDREEPEIEKTENNLENFLSRCKKEFCCSLACYLEGPLLLKEMGEGWKQLLERKEANVSLQSGLVSRSSKNKNKVSYQYHMAKIQHWSGLLAEGYGSAMEKEADNLLDSLAEQNMLTAESLNYFYQDFLYMLYGIMENKNQELHNLFAEPEEQRLYQDGMKSIDQMKSLIHHVSERYQEKQGEDDQKAAVFEVLHYINEHLEEDLKRDDLAEYVHLNPDYLARIFKKEIGITMKEYITNRKMREAQSLLKTTSLPVSFVAAKVGYSNFSYFSQTYKKVMGITPQEERVK
ncbi:MAG: response regulator transcription factor [Lachnospiraceae bacterium]|jgi:two-component system response regulator YesN